MKLSRKSKYTIARLWLAVNAILSMLQIVFLTLKLAEVVSWSWWVVLSPIICTLGLPFALILLAVIILTPKAIMQDRRYRKRIEAEAALHGLKRQPGESTGDLKKRIVRRNMVAGGNYSRKDIKDAILEAFPDVGSCQIQMDYQTNEIVLILRSAYPTLMGNRLPDSTLEEIAEHATQYIPPLCTITAINAEDIKHDTE